MKSQKLKNLDRLFKAKSVVFIGGRDLFVPINEIKRRGFKGKTHVINPKRKEIMGIKCFKSLDDLKISPDAAFIAVPAKSVVKTVKELAAIDCGGVVCYSAGFKEIGKDGSYLERQLFKACSNMPLIGPNCYGFINYLDNLALWPFAHGGFSPGYGAAIITQSGMLSSDILMTQRSVPLSFMVSVGNQAVVSIEDLIKYFCLNDKVKAIGVHIEGIKNTDEFIKASNMALKVGKPIVALKTGKSKIGKSLTKSHTGSLSGDNEVFSALFEQLGIIEVDNPIQFIETLKFLSLTNPLDGKNVIGFTCSGGGATMIADASDKLELTFPFFNKKVKINLKKKLPAIATVSNPLDYTTPIWGVPEKTSPVFKEAMRSNNYSVAILVQDFPLKGLDESETMYLNDSYSFIKEAKALKVPPVICSTFPENINKDIREMLVKKGAIPMQGIDQCLEAIASAMWFRKKLKAVNILKGTHKVSLKKKQKDFNEFDGKKYLEKKGVNIPKSQEVFSKKDFFNLTLNFPLSLKFSSPKLLHKTEIGAVKLNIQNHKSLTSEFNKLKKSVGTLFNKNDGKFFVEEMAHAPIAEMFLSLRNDKNFGKILVLGMGGTFTELFKDTATLILPISRNQLLDSLSKLKIFKLITGFRNNKKINKINILNQIFKLIKLFEDPANKLSYLEINPLFVYEEDILAIDCVLSSVD